MVYIKSDKEIIKMCYENIDELEVDVMLLKKVNTQEEFDMLIENIKKNIGKIQHFQRQISTKITL